MKKHIFLGAMLCLMASTPAWAQPKAFVQNVGQITDPELQHRKDIDFKVSQQKGLQVYVGNGSLHYQWIEATAPTDSTTLYDAYRLDMQLIGANPNATISYGKKEATYERYFLSWVNTDNSNEGKVAHYYQSVVYHNIYPKIDWKLYFTADGHLEYDFIVHPGGNVQDIQLQYNGADSVRLQNDGGLRIYTPKGNIAERAPYSFDAQTKQVVASQFVVNKQSVSFQTAPHQGTLVIDPVIEWGTYFGGIGPENAQDISMDNWGNIYAIGATSSLANIATLGAHQQIFGGGNATLGADGLLSKWDANGVLISATYYGGVGIDNLAKIAIDTLGNVYVGGYTNSNDGIATANTHKSTKGNNAYDVLLVKFDRNGNRLFGTYHGGSSNEGNQNFDMVQDNNNNLLLVFNSNSIDYPIDANAYKPIREGNDGVLVQFDNNGNFVRNTFIGGNGTDYISTIAVGIDNNVFIGGYTNSTIGIAMANAHQASLAGSEDGFVLQLDSLWTPLWGSYIGGSLTDRISNILVIDTLLFVAGITQSNNNISSPNSYNATYSNLYDGFINCFSVSGTKQWGTYINGVGQELITDLNYNNGQLFFAGQTNSNDLDTVNPLQQLNNGYYDAFIGAINRYGEVSFMSYFGGGDEESELKLVSNNTNLFGLLRTKSFGLAFGPSIHQNTISGDNELLLFKMNLCDAPKLSGTILGADTVCSGVPSMYAIDTVADAVRYHWLLPNGWQGASDSNSIMLTTGTHGGTIQVWAESACGGISDTLAMLVYIHPTSQVLITQQGNILRSNATYPSYQWFLNGQAIPGATNSTYIPTANGSYSLSVVDANGCTAVSNSLDIGHLSIAGLEPGSYSLYPNPMEQVLHIQVAQATTVYITNVLGQLVWQQSLPSGTHSIAVASWSAGMYAVVLQQGEKRAVHKIIKH